MCAHGSAMNCLLENVSVVQKYSLTHLLYYRHNRLGYYKMVTGRNM